MQLFGATVMFMLLCVINSLSSLCTLVMNGDYWHFDTIFVLKIAIVCMCVYLFTLLFYVSVFHD